MSYGLQVYNGSNEFILNTTDSGRIMYQEVASGTSGTTSGGGTYDFHSTTVLTSLIDSETLVFVKCNTNNVSWVGYPGSGGFTIYSSSSGVTFDYKILKQAENQSIPTSGYGLLVLDEDGLGNPFVVYQSDALTTRIKGTITGSGSVSGSNLYGLLVWHYVAITAAMAPSFGRIKMSAYTNTSTGISFGSVDAFKGYQVTDPEDIFNLRWINPTTGKGLVIQG
jgi:hypothetical protein